LSYIDQPKNGFWNQNAVNGHQKLCCDKLDFGLGRVKDFYDYFTDYI